jgi:hypothetical protein
MRVDFVANEISENNPVICSVILRQAQDRFPSGARNLQLGGETLSVAKGDVLGRPCGITELNI